MARRDSKRRLVGPPRLVGLDHRVHLGHLDTAPRQCGFDCVGVVAQGPDIDHLGAKVACDAVPAIQVTGLTVRYGPEGTPAAVDDLYLTAERGEVVVVLGPNGAGKTSTVESLEGYRRPVGGQVRVLGLDPIADHAALTGHIGVMLQRGGVYPMLGPRRALDLFAGYYPDPMPTEELLELAGLRAVAATPWRHLSGGEQQRLSLALALIGRPDVAFLDEPTAGVDPEGRVAIRAVVAGLKEKRVCTLLTTHELGEAERVADRIAIMSAGRIVREGTPHELLTAEPGTIGSAKTGPASVILTFGAPPGLDVERSGGRSRPRDERHGDRRRPLPTRGRHRGQPGRHGRRRHVPRRAWRDPDRPGRGPDARGGVLRSRRSDSDERDRANPRLRTTQAGRSRRPLRRSTRSR